MIGIIAKAAWPDERNFAEVFLYDVMGTWVLQKGNGELGIHSFFYLMHFGHNSV